MTLQIRSHRLLLALWIAPWLPAGQQGPRRGLETRHLHSIPLGENCEAVAFDPRTRQCFALLPDSKRVLAFDLSKPSKPRQVASLGRVRLGKGSPTSLACAPGLLAITMRRSKGRPGRVLLWDTEANQLRQELPCGVDPDCIALDPAGRIFLTANEARDTDSRDPQGSLSLGIREEGATNFEVQRLGFEAFEEQRDQLRRAGLLLRGKTLAQSLEPESVALSPDGQRAFVTCQDNNAVLAVDVRAARVTAIFNLGRRSWHAPGPMLDPSDRDGGAKLGNWPVETLPMPDGVVSFVHGGALFFATANEGERIGKTRVKDLRLDPKRFPKARELQADNRLGRFAVHAGLGDRDGDGDHDRLVGFGGRSFSIYRADGKLWADSGDDLARRCLAHDRKRFASDGDPATLDRSSPTKGVEPEGIAYGLVDGRPLLCVGLERFGAIAVYDISAPRKPRFVAMLDHPGDRRPEGLCLVPATQAPTGGALLLAAFETGTLAIYQLGKPQ